MQLVKNWLIFIITALFHSAVIASGPGKIVLVLDDLGNQLGSGKVSIQLPWVSTVAIMPQRPYSNQLADYAFDLNKEVIVHIPMANQIDFPLGPLGLEHGMGRDEFVKTAQLAIQSVPHAVGLSNHMGSLLTQDHEAMIWLMSVLKANGFYFFDSRTIASTIGWEVAEAERVPWAMRNLFLDHYREADFMAKQWTEGVQRAIAGETVIIICHPYPETIQFLSELDPTEQVQAMLAPLSNVLHYPTIVNHDDRNLPKGA